MNLFLISERTLKICSYTVTAVTTGMQGTTICNALLLILLYSLEAVGGRRGGAPDVEKGIISFFFFFLHVTAGPLLSVLQAT